MRTLRSVMTELEAGLRDGSIVFDNGNKRPLFVAKPFTSHSGKPLGWKVECDALTDDDWRCVARVIAGATRFGTVYGIPTGGVKLAAALLPYAEPNERRVLIVDDVLTTGRSMREERDHILGERGADTPVWGVVLFARSEAESDWVWPVFRLTPLFGQAKLREG